MNITTASSNNPLLWVPDLTVRSGHARNIAHVTAQRLACHHQHVGHVVVSLRAFFHLSSMCVFAFALGVSVLA